ncbi:hypothetical protein [Rhodococcus tibetensis]|uniref:Uncharacterized protein n=1 Tax=Rhodococcus tibetensis TaxID=2965064 RepID=A0ABT1QI21_9NOCA|nr:hypothetical protein [Rhodococcus sp. FXJ9.536]MCQ4121943.1 hypothetical protein [Rhodococcus sp. FXJ9.536]
MKRSAMTLAAESALALAALVLAVWCWTSARITSEFGPVAPGAPSYEGTEYSGSWIAGAAALVTAAGLLVIDVARRWVAGPAGHPAESATSPEDLGLADRVGSGPVDHRGTE